MIKKLFYLITFIAITSFASVTFAEGYIIGDFNDSSDPTHGEWVRANDNPHITLSYGKIADSNCLVITDSTGGDFDRGAEYSVVADGNDLTAFRRNHIISLDLLRNWTGYTLGWSEFHMVIEAGRAPEDTNGPAWSKGWNLVQIANWGSWNGTDPITYNYDYSTILNQIDFDNLGYLGIILCPNWGGYTGGGIYYVDNVKLLGDGMAYDPSPANHKVDVTADSILKWTKGAGAVAHDIYLGTSFSDVNDANRAIPLGVLVSENQNADANTYNPGTLTLYKTYYWRVDKVDSPGAVQKGEVWDFMTAFTGRGLVIGDFENGMNGWEPTWQGDSTFSYSAEKGVTLGAASLGIQIAQYTPDDPAYWIIQRNGVLPLSNMKIKFDVTLHGSEWSGTSVTLGPLCVQTDADPDHTWRPYDVKAIDRNTGAALTDNYTWNGTGNLYATCSVDFTGPTQVADGALIYSDWANANKMTILIALQTGGQGNGHVYIDNVRLANIRLASNPMPGTFSADIAKTPTLKWTAGTGATSHNVYFGTNETEVANAATSTVGIYKGNQTTLTYAPGTLEKGRTYYWRIDELGAPGGPWKGEIRSFTVATFEFVDDFESYTNPPANRISTIWVKGGGGTVGYLNSNYCETTIVHSGLQSMPFDYNNIVSPYDSNAARTFTTYQDWTAFNSKSLELWYRGWPVSVGSFTGSGPYTMTASGEDVWDVANLRGTGYHDECHFAYKRIETGDGSGYVTIIAKVDSISDNTSPWAKAGLMVRQSLDAGSRNGFLCITPEMGAAWQYREIDSDVSTSYDYYSRGEEYIGLKDVNTPYWLKLEINGSGGYVDAYYSVDGTSWNYISAGTPLITLPFYVGLAATAHNSTAACTTQFSNVSIIAGSVPPSWSNQDVGIKSNIAAPLYITLQDDSTAGGDKATIIQADSNEALQTEWQAWDIDLNDFKAVNPNLNLDKIKKITLGVGPKSGTKGTMYFDDIRLYPARCMPGLTPDFTGDCFVDYDDLEILADNWLSPLPVNSEIDLNDDNNINFKDFALFASDWLDEALWPIQ
ncbi:MAG: hypothetical protein A2Y10_17310 [Planctomycetes bacterium GWF2_41_51]|nr:MAG: hypothetical protein A2Y10_17310 [Planctomycetes bacterium GWF2_41_51]HBG27985.1 hypothetical protein [Phycisphaerales bacterium]